MSEHPQVTAVRQAAGLLRQERYWACSNTEELEFLREVAYHLDAMQALDGLAAYEHVTGMDACFGRDTTTSCPRLPHRLTAMGDFAGHGE